MNKHKLYAIIRLLFAGLAVAAIITQLTDSISHGRSVVNFFSFFTIESNLLAIALLALLGVTGLRGTAPKEYVFFRGGVTLFMTITGIVYTLLLSGNEVSLQTTVSWVNTVLHYIMPVVILADWLIAPPKQLLPFKKAALWLLFPLVYLTYSIIRGGIVSWYPYPFINPIENSWAHVGVMSLVIAAVAAVLGWAVCLTTMTPANKKQANARA